MTIGTWIFGFVVCFVLCIMWVGTSRKRRAKKLQRHFDRTATKLGLQISSQEQFGNRALGIDYRTNKLLFVKRAGLRLKSLIIDLNEIANCTYRKLYMKTPYKTANNQIKLLLTDILLEFDRKDHSTIAVPLFHYTIDGFPDTQQIELKAKHWEQLVQKVLPKQPASHPLKKA
jgi:hypothetical protein